MRFAKFSIEEYAAFAACFLLVHSEANAEAVYTDIPDTLLNIGFENFHVDMNYDAVVDFELRRRSYDFSITTYSSGYINSHCTALSIDPEVFGNKIAASTEIWGSAASNYFTVYFPYALAEGQLINGLLSFQDQDFARLAFRFRGQYSSYAMHGGNFYPEVIDHYLGVYFKDTTGCFHYGWIRCDVKNEGKELVVKDFAYESKCDVGIAAGDMIGDTTIVGINETNTFQATVYSFNNTIYINLNDLINKVEVHIYDLTGKEVYSATLINQFTEIKLSESKGMYVVELISEEKQHRTDKVNLQ